MQSNLAVLRSSPSYHGTQELGIEEYYEHLVRLAWIVDSLYYGTLLALVLHSNKA